MILVKTTFAPTLSEGYCVCTYLKNVISIEPDGHERWG